MSVLYIIHPGLSMQNFLYFLLPIHSFAFCLRMPEAAENVPGIRRSEIRVFFHSLLFGENTPDLRQFHSAEWLESYVIIMLWSEKGVASLMRQPLLMVASFSMKYQLSNTSGFFRVKPIESTPMVHCISASPVRCAVELFVQTCFQR